MSTQNDDRQTFSMLGNLVWFEISADNLERARKFYGSLFGWNIQQMPGMSDYWHVDTGGPDASPDGGMTTRKSPHQRITNYMLVESVEASSAKVKELGGTILLEKTTVPHMGYFAICQDPEKNVFGLWQHDPGAL